MANQAEWDIDRLLAKWFEPPQQQIVADHAVYDYDGDILIYRGGRAPRQVKHVRIHESVNDIEDNAFEDCGRLLTVETHDGLRKVGVSAFRGCNSLRRMSLKSAVEIGNGAFYRCFNLESVEFGDKLETVGIVAFDGCQSLTHLKLPSIITIGNYAFGSCSRLIDIELSDRLDTIGASAFYHCSCLQRIAMPVKRDLFEFSATWQRYTQFDGCDQLTNVDIVGEMHERVSSLRMDTTWRAEMTGEINRINRFLPTPTTYGKIDEIRQFMGLVIDMMYHSKAEHYVHVKEGITLLELALWKAKLDEKEEDAAEGRTKKAKIDAQCARKERRIKCGADVVIKNVLPFLRWEK